MRSRRRYLSGEGTSDTSLAYRIFNKHGKVIKGSDWFAEFKKQLPKDPTPDAPPAGSKRKKGGKAADVNPEWLRFQMACHELLLAGLIKQSSSGKDKWSRAALVFCK